MNQKTVKYLNLGTTTASKSEDLATKSMQRCPGRPWVVKKEAICVQNQAGATMREVKSNRKVVQEVAFWPPGEPQGEPKGSRERLHNEFRTNHDLEPTQTSNLEKIRSQIHVDLARVLRRGVVLTEVLQMQDSS